MGLDGQQFRRVLERKDSPYFVNSGIHLNSIEKLSELQQKALIWRIECESALISSVKLPNFYSLIYEDLVSDPFGELEKLFHWLHWHFSDRVKRFIKQSIGQERIEWYNKIFAMGYFGVYRTGEINTNKWVNKISQKEFDEILEILHDSPLLSLWDLSCFK